MTEQKTLRWPRSMAGLAPMRRRAGMTQAQLAEVLDIERPRLAMWEIGQSWPPARILPAMADVLLCSIDELYEAPILEAPQREEAQR